jgi:hypothetical protein
MQCRKAQRHSKEAAIQLRPKKMKQQLTTRESPVSGMKGAGDEVKTQKISKK